MPGLNKDRKRNKTIAFRVSPEEAAQIEARINLSGMPKGQYFIESLLHNKIIVRFGKYESDILGFELQHLRRKIADVLSENDNQQLVEVLTKCKLLLAELCSLLATRNGYEHYEKQ